MPINARICYFSQQYEPYQKIPNPKIPTLDEKQVSQIQSIISLLKVSKSRKQFMVASILPKNVRFSLLRIVSFVRFYEELRKPRLLSRLSELKSLSSIQYSIIGSPKLFRPEQVFFFQNNIINKICKYASWNVMVRKSEKPF